jgi:flavin-dependent dehydrogenase
MSRSDVLIAGGGLAGSAAAITLAKAGARVTLVEKTRGPHDKVCGEFLSGEALSELRASGLDPLALGAVPLGRVRIAADGEAAEAPLPFEALSLTRRVLDEALLERAAAAGVEVIRGVTVAQASARPGLAQLRLSGGKRLAAGALASATGKHDLRGARRPAGIHGSLVGLKAYYRTHGSAASLLRGSVDVVFFPGGYGGFQETEDGLVNACLVVDRQKLQALGKDPWAVFEHMRLSSPHAKTLLAGAKLASERPLGIGRVPYGYVRTRTDGAYHLGDQAAVIPSFCGEGMGLALRSGRLAAEAIVSGRSAASFQRRFAALSFARVKSTALLSRMMAAGPVQRGAADLAGRAPGLVTLLAGATRTPGTPLPPLSSAQPSSS